MRYSDFIPYDMLEKFNSIMEANTNKNVSKDNATNKSESSEKVSDDVIEALNNPDNANEISSTIVKMVKNIDQMKQVGGDQASATINTKNGCTIEIMNGKGSGEKDNGYTKYDPETNTLKLWIFPVISKAMKQMNDDEKNNLINTLKNSKTDNDATSASLKKIFSDDEFKSAISAATDTSNEDKQENNDELTGDDSDGDDDKNQNQNTNNNQQQNNQQNQQTNQSNQQNNQQQPSSDQVASKNAGGNKPTDFTKEFFEAIQRGAICYNDVNGTKKAGKLLRTLCANYKKFCKQPTMYREQYWQSPMVDQDGDEFDYLRDTNNKIIRVQNHPVEREQYKDKIMILIDKDLQNIANTISKFVAAGDWPFTTDAKVEKYLKGMENNSLDKAQEDNDNNNSGIPHANKMLDHFGSMFGGPDNNIKSLE